MTVGLRRGFKPDTAGSDDAFSRRPGTSFARGSEPRNARRRLARVTETLLHAYNGGTACLFRMGCADKGSALLRSGDL